MDLEHARPSSAYSYDGGFFITANNHGKDSFVINPEWVSEDETVKKLNGGQDVKLAMHGERGGEGDGGTGGGASRDGVDGTKPKLITWKSYASKRSKSAPPARLRNPITWVDPAVESVE